MVSSGTEIILLNKDEERRIRTQWVIGIDNKLSLDLPSQQVKLFPKGQRFKLNPEGNTLVVRNLTVISNGGRIDPLFNKVKIQFD